MNNFVNKADCEFNEQAGLNTQDRILQQLKRIADAQCRLLEIAEQSQKERNELSDKMKQAFKVQGLSAHETK